MNIDEFYNLFRSRIDISLPYTPEEDVEVKKMIRDHMIEGVRICGEHDHVYDMLASEITARLPQDMSVTTAVKVALDIGLAFGVELGKKQAEGLSILKSAQEGGTE